MDADCIRQQRRPEAYASQSSSMKNHRRTTASRGCVRPAAGSFFQRYLGRSGKGGPLDVFCS